ncbi:MAG: hypothetical protein AAFP68_20915 [Pseudomonadota bacterium]
MPKPNTKFELNVEDVDVIETALRGALQTKEIADLDEQTVTELLGRLHNQKVFYRPSQRCLWSAEHLAELSR